jgi:hypothetical protein
MLGCIDWLLRIHKRPRRTLAHSPRAVPWEKTLPWATVMIVQPAPAIPVRDNRGRGSACAKAVNACTSRSVGTNVTVKTPIAYACSAAGRRRDGKPNGVKTILPRLSTPSKNVPAAIANAPYLHHNHQSLPRLRRRVVTQQKFFRRLLCATGQGAMKRPRSRAVTRHATAAPSVVRRFAECAIVNASG